MKKFTHKQTMLAVLSASVMSTSTLVTAATANFDPATNLLKISAVNVPVTAALADTFNADLRLVNTNPIELELVTANKIAQPAGEVVHFDASIGKVFIPSVSVGNDTFFAEMELIPGSNPLKFRVSKLHNTKFEGCPSFATASTGNACVLQGTITNDVNLTNNVTWVLAGGVYAGNDNANPVTFSIEPGTRIVGQSGADFLYIRRGSKINAVGDAQHPIVMTGSADGIDPKIGPGAWAGLVLAGNAPVNGCNAGVAKCEQFDEAFNTPYGGLDANDNSGILKYVQIRYAGIEVRPDNELNALTLLGVGAGTNLDFIELYRGKDDGIEMFGGTVNFKHIASIGNSDDSVDWGSGWNGKAQFVLIKQLSDDGDNGIEADNNEVDNNSLPRAKPVLANFTAIGTGSATIGGNGALLRRGTGANIHNSIFTGFAKSCLNIDSNATFENAGGINGLTGQLTVNNSIVDCTKNFDDQTSEPFLVSAWFNAQEGNKAEKPALTTFLPSGSIQAAKSTLPADGFFDQVVYLGAFANAQDNWTKGWTIGLE